MNLTTHFSLLTMYTANIQKQQRKFLPKEFTVTDWNSLEPFFKDLLDRTIDTKKELEQWLKDQSELEAIVSEDACWRQNLGRCVYFFCARNSA